jgi:adenosylcobinamide-phosphate synthase
MGFIALIFSLLLEQVRPLPRSNLLHRAIVELADLARGATDAGERRHGTFGWLLLVVSGLLLLAAVEWLLGLLSPLLVFLLHVLVLYFTLGFRQFSHSFTEIQLALVSGDVAEARRILQAWLSSDDHSFTAVDTPIPEVCRLSISSALLASHRHVFGPLFWYVLLPGAIGPVLYRLAQMLARRWSLSDDVYGQFAGKAYAWIDWLPTRLSAAGFAVVGSFEDAVYAWRGAVAAGDRDQRALLLAAGGGALGLRLADPELEAHWSQQDAPGYELQGAEPGIESLQSAVGLVWRSVVLWISLYAMLTIATWLGR